uniref:dual-specificity kinase n=1 Tax=Clastoptera arizonana TaxID=38151 RepID=A0A1B6CDB0_9HEMI
MLRDSGYSETTSGAGIVKDMITQNSCIPVPPIMDSEVREKDSKMSGSSCRALKHAVASLNRLDDFSCEKIGSGFFSEVFKVTHKVTGQVMVLKMNLLRSNRHNMRKEVQLMNQLCHENILGFMGVCVHEGQLHALTEYINGGSLEQLIQNRTLEIPYLTRMKIALDIAKGMEYLHSRDVFHRDLTSKNVLIKKNDINGSLTAVVGDFGLAAKIPRSGARLPTVGSPYWMSPECLKGEWYDERSDIFSYGIILCELIARIEADPDFLPRTENFGLDYIAFIELCSDAYPPADFLKLALSCCNFEPKNRPSFKEIVEELSGSVESNVRRPNYRSMSCILPNNVIPPSSITAKSEEFLPATVTQPTNHRKICHRRSVSEDVGKIVFLPHTAPSDKARCHLASPRPTVNPLKHLGEAMVRNDPHYKPFPSKSNPFTALAHFKGAKKILASTNSTDLFSSCFELPSPSPYRDGPFDLSQVGSKQNSKPYERGKVFDEEFDSLKLNMEDSISAESVIKPSQVKSNNKSISVGSAESKKSKSKDAIDLLDGRYKLKSGGVLYKLESRLHPGLKAKPSSLPSSPTFSRRRSTLPVLPADIFINFNHGKNPFPTLSCEHDTVLPTNSDSTRKKASSLFSHPLFKNRADDVNPNLQDESKPPHSSLIHQLSNLGVLPDCSAVFQPGSTPVGPGLRRRGSCESGFFSSLGDDFCLPGIELVTASSVTLSSSSAASSLFLDSGATVSCSLDDIATPLRGHPHFNPHTHKRSSSIYTDSSEDVSSLGGGDLPTWDDRISLQAPQHISKMVEYFERKHVFDSVPSESSEVPSPNLTQHYQSHRELQLRRSFLHDARNESSKMNSTGVKRGVSHRLMICEGAVRSKLQLFDKK